MKKKLEYNIEKLYFTKNNKKLILNLEGWAFSYNNDDLKIKIQENNKKQIDFKILFLERNDVINKFKINKKMCGFHISIENFNAKNNYFLQIIDTDNSKNIMIDFKQEYMKFIKGTSNNSIFTRRNFKKLLLSIKNNGIKITYSKLKLLNENRENLDINKEKESEKYVFKERKVLNKWIEIQKSKPIISVILPIKDIENRYLIVKECIENLLNQQYKNFNIYPIVSGEEIEEYNEFIKPLLNKDAIVIYNKNSDIYDYIDEGYREITEDYFMILEQEDILVESALAHFVENINLNRQLKVMYSNYDSFENNNEYFNPIIKDGLNMENTCLKNLIKGFTIIYKDKNIKETEYKKYIDKLSDIIKENEICYLNMSLIHKRIIKNAWNIKKIKTIAFYLPQFHCIKENDKYWGKGFTEWVNVKRAEPMFKNHYQERKPGELGYYNLVEDKDIQLEQIKLAKEYDIYGFCYYYYWFNGKRVLEKPLDKIIENKNLDLPFCICWANENWTKRWDGLDKEIILEQKHEVDSDNRFILDILPILKDERYIKIKEAPLLVIYKIHLLKDPKNSIKVWREIAKQNGLPKIHIALVNHPGMQELDYYKADSLIEFPPHKLSFKNITNEVEELSKEFVGGVYDYKEYVERTEQLNIYNDKIFRGCMLQWDNTARRMESASIFHNFSLEDYEKWLYKCSEYSKNMLEEDENIVFINAWNEWAEGTYLEPDQKYGRKYLESTKKIVNSR